MCYPCERPMVRTFVQVVQVEFIMKYMNDYISMLELLVHLKVTCIFHLSHICEFIGYTNKIILILHCFMKIMGLTFYKHIWKKWPNLQIVEVYRVIIVPYFAWKTNHIGPSTYGPKKICGYVFLLVMNLKQKPCYNYFIMMNH